MNKGVKIILSIVVFFVGVFLSALTKEAADYGNPIGYFIIFPAIFIAIGAIWKYNPEKNNNSTNNTPLRPKDGDEYQGGYKGGHNNPYQQEDCGFLPGRFCHADSESNQNGEYQSGDLYK